MFFLRLLGTPALELDRTPMAGAARHRHSLAMLALLARATGRTLGRGKLVGLLWPEVAESAARNRLSTCLHRLRQEVEPDLLISEGSTLRLNAERVRSDLEDFEEALVSDEWEAAIRHYRGPFLDGFWLPESPPFDQWMDRERAQLRRQYREALETLARQAASQGEPREAIRWWRHLRDEAPHDSGVALALMEALAETGNRAAALQVAERHAALLESEFGTEPDPRIAEAVRTIQRPAPPAGETGTAATGTNPDLSEGPAPPSPKGRPATARERHPPPDRRVVAVLPFERLGAEADDDAFADGLHHDLLTRLSGEGELKVISRTSVLRSRARGRSIPELARELGVGTVVEGSVQKAGDRVRLNVQLIDVADDTHLWAERYDRELTARNLFDLQEELAERIANSLHSKLRGPRPLTRGPPGSTPTEVLEAYRCHAHGRYRLDERTEDGMRAALAHFQRAAELDPEYPEAQVGVADALTLLHEYGYEGAAPALAQAEAAARHAIELDPGLAGAHASIGLLHEARREGPEAIRSLERAVELQPSYADAHNWLSWASQLLGRAEGALASARRAVELNPLSAESVSNLSVSLTMNGHPEEGLHEAQRGRELQPGWGTTIFYEALALFDLGRYGEAGRLLEGQAVPWAGCGPEATVALVHAIEGDASEARRAMEEFRERGEHAAVGLLHAAFGEVEAAMEAFRAVEVWDYWPTLTMHHYYTAVLGPLRRDPRFEPVMARVRGAWGLL